jgi:hypothetical protein
VIKPLCVVFIGVVGSQVEVPNELHLLGKDIKNVPSEDRVSDSFELIQIEPRPEMIEDRVSARRVSAVSQSLETEVL